MRYTSIFMNGLTELNIFFLFYHIIKFNTYNISIKIGLMVRGLGAYDPKFCTSRGTTVLDEAIKAYAAKEDGGLVLVCWKP